MIEAKISCDSCDVFIIVSMRRCYEEGEWRIDGLSFGSDRIEPKKLKGWEYDLYFGSNAICPKCNAKKLAELEAKRPRTLEERIEALETKKVSLRRKQNKKVK
jgi:hypothetical protein